MTTLYPSEKADRQKRVEEIKINQNMVVRFEYRHDESDQLVFAGENAGELGGTQDTLAVNALVYF